MHFLDGILAEIAGHKDQALAAYQLAVENLDRIRAGLSKQEMRQSFMDDDSVQELYRRLIALLTLSGEKEKAWEYLERNKARVFLESLGGRRFASHAQPAAHPTPNSADPIRATAELAKLEQQIIDTRVALVPENESLLRAAGRQPELLKVRLKEMEAQFALIREKLGTLRKPCNAAAVVAPDQPGHRTEAQLPKGTALIEYAILDHELAAFVVTHSSAQQLHSSADTKALATEVGDLTTLLSSPRGQRTCWTRRCLQPPEILLGPVMRALAPEIDSLIIVPTQTLSLIPFQALPLPEKNAHVRGLSTDEPDPGSIDPSLRTLVIDRYSVAYLPSASTLQFMHFGPPSASQDLFSGRYRRSIR